MKLTAIIEALNLGETEEELEERFRAVVAGVRRTGCPGALTFTIKVAPSTVEREVIFTPKITTKIPSKAGAPETWVAREDGQVEPKQLRLSIDVPPRTPRKAA